MSGLAKASNNLTYPSRDDLGQESELKFQREIVKY
jgi:hypothetical protein